MPFLIGFVKDIIAVGKGNYIRCQPMLMGDILAIIYLTY